MGQGSAVENWSLEFGAGMLFGSYCGLGQQWLSSAGAP